MMRKEDPWNRFQLINRVGRGAFGEVYRALDKQNDREVAIKIVSLGEDIDDLLEEINFMSQLNSPQLVRYYCSYSVEDRLWIAMEYFDCGSLQSKCILSEHHDNFSTTKSHFSSSLEFFFRRTKTERTACGVCYSICDA